MAAGPNKRYAALAARKLEELRRERPDLFEAPIT
jgi:hypothetical protein